MCFKSLEERQGGSIYPILPEEIWLLIFEVLVQNGCPWSSLATVSREWQTIVERYNFALIKLTSPRLANFDAMTRRCRALVGCIWLYLELDAFDCSTCERLSLLTDKEYPTSITDNGWMTETFPDVFQGLFAVVLSTWESNGDLKLDISFGSPSHSLTFVPDTPSGTLGSETMQQKMVKNSFHDPRHGWAAGFRDSAPPNEAPSEVYEDAFLEGSFNVGQIMLKWWNQLPLVPAVTSFLIRQQNRRIWEPQSLALMLAHFPRLQELHYEPWRHRDCFYSFLEPLEDEGYQELFESFQSVGKTLKKVVIFGNFDQEYSNCMAESRGLAPDDCATISNPSPAVCQMIALASLELEHLAVSFIVDASKFFQIETSYRWPNLSSLSLTSKHLTPDEDPASIATMLQTVAAAATKMPKLDTLEIWNGGKSSAALFKYQTSRKYRQAEITWRGTWRLTMDQSVIQAWEAVLHQWGGWRLNFVQEVLDEAVIKSHGDAIHYLNLSNEVIRPISLQHIRSEQQAMEGRKDSQQG